MIHQQRLSNWDHWIRQGESAKVRQLCQALNFKKIPRALIVEYAQIARRVGSIDLILKWLGPIVHPKKILEKEVTPQEKAIYGLGLVRAGAFREAQQILEGITAEEDPQAAFYRASLFINQWNYRKAIPQLKKYIRDPAVLPYAKLVGRLNLCASLISVRKFDAAEIEIERLMRKLQLGKTELLRGNLFEIRSQFYFEKGDWGRALEDLGSAEALLKRADPRSRLYVDKWKTIIRQKQLRSDSLGIDCQNLGIGEKVSREEILSLGQLRERAVNIQDWETLRDCDLNEAVDNQDFNLGLRVFWGSHLAPYKRRVLDLFHNGLTIGNEFVWISPYGKAAESVDSDLVALAPTTLLKKFFFLMTRELYRPLRITELSDFLHPQEFFNPQSTPEKIHSLVLRARNWLENMGLPLKIVSYRKGFKLEFTGPGQLLLHLSLSQAKKISIPVKIKAQKTFTSQEWARENNVSARTARRQLAVLVKLGQIGGTQQGPRTFYWVRAL